ncbi:SLBB domain-containing protein [Granulicella arctica]|uniref:Protein involved in polysaccharide export with SLBB domain n=1 Tax=Granulicella arctica TaxID=940613 RepID=A0A7Y9PEH2_9BACT|nr:SLBB domain-containing protein [Granulicella arctica]NYF78210.1 protein involved in polysaccharide export with SLBB domain [Granulicella arctica]
MGVLCFVPVSALAQSSTDSPFSSGLSSQSDATASQQPTSDTSSSTTQTQVGSKSLTQSRQPTLGNGQQDSDTQTERNGRYVNQNFPEAPVQLTAFQRLAAASVGKVLPIYGANLFTNVPSTFSPVDRIPVTPDYVIGPGDELLIRMWGQVTLDGHFTVDRSGNVYIPQVGAVRVAGVSFAQVTDYLRTQIGRTFRNFDLNVNIGQLRSIQIFIVGEARRPGSYTVSSLSTLVNALFASGGPSPMGSMRSIQVKRGKEIVTTFDLYDLLLKGDKSKDVQLVSGDVIYIPPVGPMVALAGSIDTPGLYELKSESTVKDAIALAGGLSTLAQNKDVRIERIAHHDSRTVLDVKLDGVGMATPLSDGDILEISPIIDGFKDAVTLRGNVAEPRRFAWFPGMRIKDLIPDKDALLTRDYWQQRNELGLPVLDSTPDVRRYAPDTPIAQVNGRGVSPTRSSTALMLNLPNAQDSDTNVYGHGPQFSLDGSSVTDNNSNTATQNGAMNSSTTSSNAASNITAGTTNLSSDDSSRSTRNGALAFQADRNDAPGGNDGSSASGTSLSAGVTGAARRFPRKNAVVLSAPDVDWAYAVVQRLNRADLTTQLIPFNLGRVVIDSDNTQNLELQPGDVVTVFSKADIRVPQSQQTKYVRLEGEFKAAGTYSVAPGETLRQLVARAGGLADNAYLYGSQFTRESTRVLQQQRLSDYAADLDRRIKLAEANAANNALNPQDEVANIAGLQNARTVAMRLSQLKATGRIVLNVRPDSSTIADIPDLPLEDGDAFVVPQVPLSVDVFGSVYTQNSFLYNSHKRAVDYIREAGGGTRTADVKRSYIVRADGSIISRQFSSALFTGNFDSIHLHPGDAVVVPEQVDKRPLLRNLVDIATIIGQFGLGIAAINVL